MSLSWLQIGARAWTRRSVVVRSRVTVGGRARARVLVASADGEVGRTTTSQPLTGRLQIGPGQHYFCYHAQLASLSRTWSTKGLSCGMRPGEPFDLVCYIAEGDHRGKFAHWPPEGEPTLIEVPNEYEKLRPGEQSVILKIHGAIDRAGPEAEWDSYVITEDHYIDYLTRTEIQNLVPVMLAMQLRRSHFLFLGYSMRDWNLRVILHRIWG